MSPAFLFEDFPRAALFVLVGGLVVRGYAVVRRPPAPSDPPPGWPWPGRLGALALGLLLLAHLAALLAPQALVTVTRAHLRLYVLEGSGFLVGFVGLLAWARMMFRHLRAEGPSLAGVGDSMLLALIALALGSGLVTAILYRWASVWGVATLTPYVRSLGRGRPLGVLASQMPFPVQLHLVSTFAALAVLPFSRLALALIVPAHRLGRRLAGWLWQPLRAAARHARAWLVRHNPGAWIWPEEE